MTRPSFAFVLIGALVSSTAQAETVSLVAHLLGSSEVPATASDAFAEAQFTYDTAAHQLQYYVNYDGIAPAKVDLHGPAAAGVKAASVINLPLSESPVSGAISLTPSRKARCSLGKCISTSTARNIRMAKSAARSSGNSIRDELS
jgi:hypothetical protein